MTLSSIVLNPGDKVHILFGVSPYREPITVEIDAKGRIVINDFEPNAATTIQETKPKGKHHEPEDPPP